MAKATATTSPRSTKTKPVDPLDTLLADATTLAPKPTGGKKKTRNTLDLTDEEAGLFNRFCMADATLKMAKGHQEGSKAVLLPLLTDKLISFWCEVGHRTPNPRLQTPTAQVILQARETLKFDLPANEDGEPCSVTEALMQVGFDEETAEAIRESEFNETTELRFANISKLRNDNDNPLAKKTMDKLLKLVIENFTPAERALLLEKVNNVTINEGFLDRSVKHVDGDPVKLKALFQVVRPTFLMSQVEWSGGLDVAIKTLEGDKPQPITTEAIPAQSTAIPKWQTSEDGNWKASAVGNVAKLYMIQGDSQVEVATKTCAGGASHAEQTCKKWMRDENYRGETLAKK
jgi:hypothetical protein